MQLYLLTTCSDDLYLHSQGLVPIPPFIAISGYQLCKDGPTMDLDEAPKLNLVGECTQTNCSDLVGYISQYLLKLVKMRIPAWLLQLWKMDQWSRFSFHFMSDTFGKLTYFSFNIFTCLDAALVILRPCYYRYSLIAFLPLFIESQLANPPPTT